eukprot:scaffold3571_cov176-Amphora_coffeaeformis.AAC.1
MLDEEDEEHNRANTQDQHNIKRSLPSSLLAASVSCERENRAAGQEVGPSHTSHNNKNTRHTHHRRRLLFSGRYGIATPTTPDINLNSAASTIAMTRQPRRLLQALATVSPWLAGSVAGGVAPATSLATAARLETTRQSLLTVSGYHQNRQYRFLSVRGGGGGETDNHHQEPPAYETRADPAPGTPFHFAFPVHDLELAKDFYGRILGCEEGRSSAKWQDYSLHGHQIVAHWVGNDYRCIDYYNPVDGDEVPVPHTGLCLTVDQFHDLAKRVEEAGIEFIIKPHLRFKGMPGEQFTMFFKDPSGNNLEFKAMTKPANLFAKYNVADK